jgi:hypothetical protein
MDPNPSKVPLAPGVTSEFTICRLCSAFVWDEEVHDKFHDSFISRHATFAVTKIDGSTFCQFVDGTQVTIPADASGDPFDGDRLIDFMRGVNEDIDPDFAKRHPIEISKESDDVRID